MLRRANGLIATMCLAQAAALRCHDARAADGAAAPAANVTAQASSAAAQAADIPATGPSAPLQQVVVVATAPLTDSELPLDEVPANVQQIRAGQLSRLEASSLASVLGEIGGSIDVNDTQGNPFQPDVSFRGFTASPVLGTPQGISVFVDGVRVNEAFGDAVDWDLIPDNAIARLQVIPGSDPVFGLNTLGGAVAVTTKRGFDFPGTLIEAYGGSFGRRAAEVETGGHGDRFDYFLAGNLFDDNGWGQHNPSRVRQGFGKAGYRDGTDDVTLSFTYADNTLEGNQTLPLSMLSDPTQSYTWPDIQTNRMAFVNLDANHRLADRWTLGLKAYYRKVSTGVFNSNVNNDYDPGIPIGQGNEPTCNVIEGIDQYRPGAALQLTGRSTIGGHRNTLIAGASYDAATTDFRQLAQEADASRDTSTTAPAILGTLLRAVNHYSGVYVTDTIGITDRLFFNASGRFNHATVALEDRLGTALNGNHAFDRFNPAVGVTFNPSRRLTLYAGYDQGMRVPTPIELACADRNAPCSLPNAFSSDPPLKDVVARTVELGARGSIGDDVHRAAGILNLSAAIFRTNLDDDIEFVSSGGGAISAGYFENVSQTRRQGIEVSLGDRRGPFSVSAQYTYLEATYQSPLYLNSPDNSSAAPLTCPTCTDIAVRPGNRIPGMPRNIVKLRAEYMTSRTTVGLTVMGQSDQYARGDENNQDVNGPIPGFVIVNLDAHYDLSSRWGLFTRIDNLLDRRYYTYGVLGENVFTAPGGAFDPTGATWRAEQYRTVGAPFGLWFGVQYHLD